MVVRRMIESLTYSINDGIWGLFYLVLFASIMVSLS